MKIFPIMILVGLCAMITFGAVFTAAMFSSTSREGNNNGTFQQNLTEQYGGNSTLYSINATAHGITAYSNITAWIYVIAVLLIIATLVLAFKLMY